MTYTQTQESGNSVFEDIVAVFLAAIYVLICTDTGYSFIKPIIPEGFAATSGLMMLILLLLSRALTWHFCLNDKTGSKLFVLLATTWLAIYAGSQELYWITFVVFLLDAIYLTYVKRKYPQRF